MRSIRRAMAPRLIEWTGERMVPWAPDVQVIYEHLHRYWFAADLARGRRVLDVGSGEGYGTAILASVADSATGIELDQLSVLHSRTNYAAPNLEFRVGSALDMSDFSDDEFGLITCFEVIEHLAEQDTLMSEIQRVLAPDGVLVCSTPDRVSYTDIDGQDNPFHVHELDEPEFRALLGARFEHVRMWGQRTTTGSTMFPLDSDGGEGGQTIFVERDRDGSNWSQAAAPRPLYMVAAASAQPLPQAPGHVTLADPGMTLLRTAESRVADELGQVHRRAGERIRQLERERSDRGAEVRTQLETNLDLERKADDLQGHIRYLYDEVAIINFELQRVHESIAWRLIEQARGRLQRPGGDLNALGRALSLVLTRAAPLLRRDGGGGDDAAARLDEAGAVDKLMQLPPLRFPEYEAVKVSIVIPVHDQPEATLACLRAISIATNDIAYEVIVADDASGPKTTQMLARMRNLRVLRNDDNQGFLRTANRAFTSARGEHVVFLNNDTEVQPGWLSSLVRLLESAADVGAVGAKLLLPNGRVQEAGAIVWRDGSARHAGRGEHPEEPALNYVREVDYVSGACLLVRGDVLRELGGFDERYTPAYYEDVDLCFAIRARGLKVLYQPRAEVVHHEGTSHGSDVSKGVKAHQVTNAKVFADKWRETLDSEQPEEDLRRLGFHADRARGPRVLVVDHRVPRTDEDAGSVRMWEMLLALRDLGCRVTFLADNHDRSEPHTTQLQQAGIEVLYGQFDEREVIRGANGDLHTAILSRPTVAWRYLHLLREFAPQARVVYDTVDLHYVREQRHAAASGDPVFERVSTGFRELEFAIIRSCDETIAVSAGERNLILAENPDAQVRVIPTINRVAAQIPPARERTGLMFLGGFHHSPNADAAVHLVEDLLPRIRAELGPLTLKIVGSHPTAEVLALDDVQDVEVTGFVDDVAPYLQRARVMVAPLLYGAGVNGKLTHSMAHGLPVVTTPIGAEGLAARHDIDLLIGEDDEAFVAAVVQVYRDDELWDRLSLAGRALAAERFCPQVARDALSELIGFGGATT